jgi:hypothetical protein
MKNVLTHKPADYSQLFIFIYFLRYIGYLLIKYLLLPMNHTLKMAIQKQSRMEELFDDFLPSTKHKHSK